MPHSVHFSGLDYIEPLILRNVMPAGPVIGKYADTPVRETVRDEWGRSYRYAGITAAKRNGTYDPNVLQDGEFVLPPGIIYRMLDTRSAA